VVSIVSSKKKLFRNNLKKKIELLQSKKGEVMHYFVTIKTLSRTINICCFVKVVVPCNVNTHFIHKISFTTLPLCHHRRLPRHCMRWSWATTPHHDRRDHPCNGRGRHPCHCRRMAHIALLGRGRWEMRPALWRRPYTCCDEPHISSGDAGRGVTVVLGGLQLFALAVGPPGCRCSPAGALHR
jgi:hypothetical protein